MIWLVVTGCHFFPINIGLHSSSQLTNSYFSEGFFPNHQPVMLDGFPLWWFHFLLRQDYGSHMFFEKLIETMMIYLLKWWCYIATLNHQGANAHLCVHGTGAQITPMWHFFMQNMKIIEWDFLRGRYRDFPLDGGESIIVSWWTRSSFWWLLLVFVGFKSAPRLDHQVYCSLTILLQDWPSRDSGWKGTRTPLDRYWPW